MTKVFVPNIITTKELLAVIREIEVAGYDKNQAFIGADFLAFAASMQKGDTAVVYSLSAFGSVTQILSVFEQLNQRGVAFESIKEPWFQDAKIQSKELMMKLFQLSEQLHASGGLRCEPRIPRKALRKNPKVLQIASRVALAAELIAKKMSVSEACQTAGCSVSAYYTHRKNQERFLNV